LGQERLAPVGQEGLRVRPASEEREGEEREPSACSAGCHRPLRVGIFRIFSWRRTRPWTRASALGGHPGT
jgi:hypothetical protein